MSRIKVYDETTSSWIYADKSVQKTDGNALLIKDLTQEEYDALTDDQKNNGTLYNITDATTQIATALGVTYNNTTSDLESTNVQAAIDEITTDISELIKISTVLNSSAVTISANSASSMMLEPSTIDGYTIIGVLRYFIGSNHLITYNVGINGIQMQNATSSAITVEAGGMSATYLYVKSEFIS